MTVDSEQTSELRVDEIGLLGKGARSAESRFKRALDLFISGALILFLAPLLAAIAAAVILSSPGPVLFVQRRTGLDGRAFKVFKFRTMRVQEDGEDVRQATRGDTRVTSVGRFLRRTSLDELPQFYNVFRGEMSLVGPRPHALAHDQYYGALIPHYIHRFRAKPGITGLAQVQGFRGEIKSIPHMEQRIEADNDYIDNWSFGRDIQILTRTVVVVFFQDSAY